LVVIDALVALKRIINEYSKVGKRGWLSIISIFVFGCNTVYKKELQEAPATTVSLLSQFLSLC